MLAFSGQISLRSGPKPHRAPLCFNKVVRDIITSGGTKGSSEGGVPTMG